MLKEGTEGVIKVSEKERMEKKGIDRKRDKDRAKQEKRKFKEGLVRIYSSDSALMASASCSLLVFNWTHTHTNTVSQCVCVPTVPSPVSLQQLYTDCKPHRHFLNLFKHLCFFFEYIISRSE